MSKRCWLLGVGGLVLIALLVACGSNYNPSSNGLVLVGSQGGGLIETFSFDLNSGSVNAVGNSPNDTASETCVLNGLPGSMVIDPAGAYAYAAITGTNACGGQKKKGLMAFKVNSNGTTTPGSFFPDPNPVFLTMDSKGKFLFVAEGGGVNAYAVNAGSLTPVPGTFTFINGTGFNTPNFAAVATTPTVFPSIGINGVQNAVCSAPGEPAPSAEYLYAVDSVNNVVWEFSVNMSTGALGNLPTTSSVQNVPADQIPLGVTVDPCNRFVFVSNSQSNKISAYTICNGSSTQSQTCSSVPGSLVAVDGSPFSLSGSANGPGPLLVDPFGNNLYVVGTLSNTISLLKIAQVSGALTALTPATVATGLQPTSITVRGDGSWLFVTNFNAATVSQYQIAPATGVLSALPAIQTDNYPFGVAVK